MKKIVLGLAILLLMCEAVFAQKPEMVKVEGGTFVMGNDRQRREAPEHKVTVSTFFMSKYEISFEKFDKYCTMTGEKKPEDAHFGRGKNPVINITWISAVEYCNWLSKVYGLDKCYSIRGDSSIITVSCDFNKNGYRLPTEAEWEYAAKGGNKFELTTYSGGDNADDVAWYKFNSGAHPHKVGSKKANELGLHDMSGNVKEWCWDYYSKDFYSNSTEDNPTGPSTGVRRVYRGGAYNDSHDGLRLTLRSATGQNKSEGTIGFRVVRRP